MGMSLPFVDLGNVYGNYTAKHVAAGYDHTCALLTTGTIKCVGANTWGQLGYGLPSTREIGDSSLEVGKYLGNVDLGTGRTAKQVAAGNGTTCALLETNEIMCWGKNFWGQLGQGNTNALGDQANEMGNYLPYVALGELSFDTQVGVGYDHVCGLLDTFNVKCFGSNIAGKLGYGDQINRGDNPNEMGTFLPFVSLSSVAPVSTQCEAGMYFSAAFFECRNCSAGTCRHWNCRDLPQCVFQCSGCDTTCGVKRGINGSISDGSGPLASYVNNADCSWIIAPPLTRQIVLNVSELDLEERYDSLAIYECQTLECTSPRILAELSGRQVAVVTSGTPIMKVTFRSDGSIVKPGFNATWRAITIPRYGVDLPPAMLHNDTGYLTDEWVHLSVPDVTERKWIIAPNFSAPFTLTLEIFNVSMPGPDDWIKVDSCTNLTCSEVTNSLPLYYDWNLTFTNGAIRITMMTGERHGNQDAWGFEARWHPGQPVLPVLTKYTGAVGQFTDGWEADYPMQIRKEWLVKPQSAHLIVLNLSTVELGGPNDYIVLKSCMQEDCVNVEWEHQVYSSAMFTSRTGIMKLQLVTAVRYSKGQCDGFRAQWVSDAPEVEGQDYSHTLIYSSGTGSFTDGWLGLYPEYFSRTWILAPENAETLSVQIDDVGFLGQNDHVNVSFCLDIECKQFQNQIYVRTADSFTSSTGIIKVDFITFNRPELIVDAYGFKATWTSSSLPDNLEGYNSFITYTSSVGTLSDGWGTDYPAMASRTWKIAPTVRLPLILVFSSVSLPGTHDYLEATSCTDVDCSDVDSVTYINLDSSTVQSRSGVIKLAFITGARDPVFGCEGHSLGCGGFQLSWSLSGSGAGMDIILPVAVSPLPRVCNNLFITAEEILIKLDTVIMPTNSTGFWLDYWTLPANSAEASVLSSALAECASPRMQERQFPQAWSVCASYFGGTEIWLFDDESGEKWPSTRGTSDNWGVGPNGTVIWTVKAPAGAQSITITAPELVFFEQDKDFVSILACRREVKETCTNSDDCTECTEIYKMTGTIPRYSSFCDIKLNVHEIRVIFKFDSTNNFESRVDRMCWKWDANKQAEETFGSECPAAEYPSTNPTKAIFALDNQIKGKEQRMTWIFKPTFDAKGITVDFTQVSLPWGFRIIVFWDCEPGGLCLKMADAASFLKPQTEYGGVSSENCFEEENGVMKFKSGKNLFDCYMTSCWQDKNGWGPGSPSERCYIPAPRVCTYTFPSREVRVTIISAAASDSPETPAFDGVVRQLEASFAFANTPPAAVLDGDCRLLAEGANNVLTAQSGDIVFDANTWMAKEDGGSSGLGWPLKSSRVRWVIRPSQPTQSITLSFKNLDLSPQYMVDLLYILPDCNAVAPSQYAEDILTDASLKARVLNGNGKVAYVDGNIPCPVTISAQCVILELDMTRRFAYTQESRQALEGQGIVLAEKEDYFSSFKGFSASYTSSSAVQGLQTDWVSGGTTATCQPEYPRTPPPAPKFEWNELCCTQEEGNAVFDGNFWANLSIKASIPPGASEDDYKVIYRVEPYNAAGATYLKERFNCDQSDFDYVEGWHPSEMKPYDEWVFYKQLWTDTQTGAFPGNLSAYNQSSLSHGKLWFEKRKFVRIHGKPQIVEPSFILLNAPKPASDRPEITSPTMHSHVTISAVVCKANRILDQTYWTKSEVAATDQIFVLGPSVTVVVDLLAQPASLVNLNPDATLIQQLNLSQPLIRSTASKIAAILGIPERQLGVLQQIDAINISISRSESTRRAGYKTSIVAKPGYQPEKPKETPPPEEVDEVADEDLNLYDVSLTMSILCRSIKESAYMSAKLSTWRRQLTSGSLHVQVQVPKATQVGAGGHCRSHYDCTPTGLFCSSKNKCEECRFCSIDKVHSINGGCPTNLCPRSGGFPECVDGKQLVEKVSTCRSSYPFSIWKYNETQTTQAPRVRPEAKARPKFVTPNNRLVGALMITQHRRKQVNCSVDNPLLQKYLESSGAKCQSSKDIDASPFSLDPTFQRFSEVYNGKLDVSSVYFSSERADDRDRSPMAFFPHQHDPLRSKSAISTRRLQKKRKLAISDPSAVDQVKEQKYIHGPSRDTFKIYFDETLTGKQGDRMLQFLKDGKWIDARTQTIQVDLVTYNAQEDIFVICRFWFEWQSTGRIRWDYKFNALDITVYHNDQYSTIRFTLEVIVLLMLLVNLLVELRELLAHVISFSALEYIADPFNYVDIGNFVFLILTAAYWGLFWQLASSFEIPESFQILNDVNTDVRPFLTNADQELAFLQFMDRLDAISDTISAYTVCAGISVLLFVCRILKSLDFQERMGLVTKTIGVSAYCFSADNESMICVIRSF
jgi:hypothetical protein